MSHKVECIDVSHHNGKIDWLKVKNAGVCLAFAKATQGTSFTDPRFKENFEGMKKNGIIAGAYHYLQGADDVDNQVTHIKKTLKEVNFNTCSDFLAIDVEASYNGGVSKDKMADCLASLLNKLRQIYTFIIIYTNPSYWENNVNWKKYDFSTASLWIANYTSADQPKLPTTWKKWYIWQYSETGKVDGIDGNVDLNKTNQ